MLDDGFTRKFGIAGTSPWLGSFSVSSFSVPPWSLPCWPLSSGTAFWKSRSG